MRHRKCRGTILLRKLRLIPRPRTFVTSSVTNQLEIRDRARLESDVALRVFERVFTWVRIVSTIVGIVVALVAGLGLWKASDWWSSVNAAKQNIKESSDKARADVQGAVKGLRRPSRRQPRQLRSNQSHLAHSLPKRKMVSRNSQPYLARMYRVPECSWPMRGSSRSK